MAETNLIKKADLARVREVDFVTSFSGSIKKLVEALGVTRKIAKQAGTVLKVHTVSGTLGNGVVAEGDTIPLSKYTTTETPVGEMTLLKWRKATSAEAIIDRGYDQAVSETTDKMLKDVQKKVKTDFFTFLSGVTSTSTATGADLQSALADAWGELQILFEDDDIESVYFLNPKDVSKYLGAAQISTQTAFGMTYIENFLGLGTVILNSAVTEGSFYATAKDNIVLYYIPVNGADLNEAFSFTSDETGYIGIHEEPDYTNMTASDTVVEGIKLFADYANGIVKGTITATTATTEGEH